MNHEVTAGQLCDLFLQTLAQYRRLEKELCAYGGACPLSLSEVHLLTAVGKHQNINITNLAKLQGTSKSAVSQMTRKLAGKGFLHKAPSPHTENEVCLFLTEKGQAVFVHHRAQHARLCKELAALLDRYPPDTAATLARLAQDLQALWSDYQKEETV